MIVAPHPDDDVLAAGGLIQHVLGAGGEVFVVFVTDGDKNPWPQHVVLRKLFLGAAERGQWGAIRRREALASLACFGVREESAEFLALPDSKLSRLARRGDERLIEAVRRIAQRFDPTMIVGPSSFDLHPDHRAVAFSVHRALPQAPIVTYVVHGRPPAERIAFSLPLNESERARKREAIVCHDSQLRLSRTRFLSYVRDSESFLVPEHDVVRVESAVRERVAQLRHALLVVFGGYPAAESPSGVQAAADVQDGAGHVARLL